MTVAELIAKLQELPQGMDVYLEYDGADYILNDARVTTVFVRDKSIYDPVEGRTIAGQERVFDAVQLT